MIKYIEKEKSAKSRFSGARIAAIKYLHFTLRDIIWLCPVVVIGSDLNRYVSFGVSDGLSLRKFESCRSRHYIFHL